jgi:uncharacterized protein Yka (UPF0111/DUF47 family)
MATSPLPAITDQVLDVVDALPQAARFVTYMQMPNGYNEDVRRVLGFVHDAYREVGKLADEMAHTMGTRIRTDEIEGNAIQDGKSPATVITYAQMHELKQAAKQLCVAVDELEQEALSGVPPNPGVAPFAIET